VQTLPYKALLVLQEPQERLAHREYKAFKAYRVLLAQQVLQAVQVRLGLQELLVRQALTQRFLVHKDLKVYRVSKDLRGLLVRHQRLLDPRVSLVLQELQVRLALKEQTV
jgi:hypothetical protein